jgi:hypothetical protein
MLKKSLLVGAGCSLLLGGCIVGWKAFNGLKTGHRRITEIEKFIDNWALRQGKDSAFELLVNTDDGNLGYDIETNKFNFTESNRKDLVRLLGGECFEREIADKVEVLHSVAERARKTAEEGWGLYGGKTLQSILTAPDQYPGYFDIEKWIITESNQDENEFIVNFVCDKLESDGLENCKRVFYNAGNHRNRMQQFSVGYNWGKRKVLAENKDQYCDTAKQWAKEITARMSKIALGDDETFPPPNEVAEAEPQEMTM